MQSSWRWPNSPRRTPPRSSSPKNPFITHGLSHTMSMADLHDQSSWQWDRQHSSSGASSSSSSSYDEGVITPTASDFAEASRSRTPTPTAPPISVPFATPYYGEKVYASENPKNPWARAMPGNNRPSPPVSPRSSPSSNSHSPDARSRTTTPTLPIAPQPVRPFIVEPELVPARYESTRASTLAMFAASVQSTPTPGPYSNSNSSNNIIENDKLPVQFITPELIQFQLRKVSQIVPKQGWKSASMVYQWAIKHPKTALLLWMADDLQAWRKANFMGLEDSKLPYAEEDLVGVAVNPAKVVALQWRVAIKQLPRGGAHTEFQTQETVPLKEHRAPLSAPHKIPSKRLDCVKYCDGTTSAVYVRKRLDVSSKPDKESILAQIKSYHRLDHANIAKIMTSYARGQTVAFITPYAESNLDDYLDVFSGASEADQLLTWVVELSSALKYLHSQSVVHRAIRPQKILIDPHSHRISFTVFGIAQPARFGGALLAPYSTDPAYLYAAPETISRRETTAAADIFSLGCVFLEMATAAKGEPVSHLAAYRAAQSHDASFHANLERVMAWTELLKTGKVGGSGSGARRERVGAGVTRVLTAVRGMLAAEASGRPSMKKVLSYLEQSSTGRVRRRSVDVGMELARVAIAQPGVWGDLESLNGYYHPSFLPRGIPEVVVNGDGMGDSGVGRSGRRGGIASTYPHWASQGVD